MILGFSNPLHPLETILRHVLDWLHGTIGLPWAWSVVVLTILVRILLVPLMIKQIHSMQSLQRHAPEMKAIQQKYKNDKQKQQEELMKFYRENNVNPAASCLPILLQMPVFFALYFVLRHFSDHPPGGSLSWLGVVPNISHKATSHWSGFVLLVIYVASQMASTYYMGTTMDKAQRTILLIMPIAFVFFIANFPVGLVLYWMTTNLWVVGQGLITRRLIPKTAAPTLPKRTSRTAPAPAPAVVEDVKPAKPAPPVAPRKVKRKKQTRRR
ncbi:MAG TPA: YidC/Oxa1 family membrane protein insertase [Gaiellaceae bacterium]